MQHTAAISGICAFMCSISFDMFRLCSCCSSNCGGFCGIGIWHAFMQDLLILLQQAPSECSLRGTSCSLGVLSGRSCVCSWCLGGKSVCTSQISEPCSLYSSSPRKAGHLHRPSAFVMLLRHLRTCLGSVSTSRLGFGGTWWNSGNLAFRALCGAKAHRDFCCVLLCGQVYKRCER